MPCSDWFSRRDDALRAHATQIDPTSRFFFTPLEVQARVWPTEDYELVHSLVETTTPESDLFSGIPFERAADRHGEQRRAG